MLGLIVQKQFNTGISEWHCGTNGNIIVKEVVFINRKKGTSHSTYMNSLEFFFKKKQTFNSAIFMNKGLQKKISSTGLMYSG